MELIVVISLLVFSFFALQTHCASLQIQLQSSNEQAAKGVQPFLPSPPRKLRFTEELVEFKANGAQHATPNTKQKEDVSGKGKAYEKDGRMEGEGRGGTRQQQQQGMEGPDISQYFTMDYSHVRRRRPIHNKSLPVGP